MSTLKEWSLGFVFAVMATPVTSLSAASIALPRSLESESYQAKTKVASEKVTSPKSEPTSSNPQVVDKAPDTLSYVNKALQSLFVLSKAGLKIVKAALEFVRRHPGKALTIALAFQNKTSSIKRADAKALSPRAQYFLSVTNLFQNITANDKVVPLLGMTASERYESDFFCNATLMLSDTNAGTISTSCNSSIGTFFSDGVWNTFGDSGDVNVLLNCIIVTRALGYFHTIYINSIFNDVDNSDTMAEGLIELNLPNATNSDISLTTQPFSTTKAAPSTSNMSSLVQETQSASTPASSRINTTKSTTTMPSNSPIIQSPPTVSGTLSSRITSFSQGAINSANTSSATAPTSSSAHEESTNAAYPSSTPFAASTNMPPYAIIGGAVGGGLFLCSIIAGVVAWVRGWCGMHRASSSEDMHGHELDIQHSSNRDRSSNYGLIIVAQPQSLKKSEYDDVSVTTSKSQYDLFPQPSSNSGYVGLPAAAIRT